MASQPTTFITPEEYLTLEHAATTRSEYYNGEMFAMAGGTPAHNVIVSNIGFALKERLRGRDCTVYLIDVKLGASEKGPFSYPDIMVICGKPVAMDKQADVLTNPILIVEVLSESTKDYDRGGKFHQYMRIPTFKEYLTVSQTEMLVDHSIRQPDGSWLLREIGPDNGVVPVSSLGIDLTFTDIYEEITF